MQKSIISVATIEGIHCWPKAAIVNDGEVAYLSNLHRHLFTFKVEFPISHDDRDKEFINFKHNIEIFIRNKYYDFDLRLCNFNSMSCEMLAMNLIEKWPDIISVEVYEDNENGIRILNN